jgi:rubrerythrin
MPGLDTLMLRLRSRAVWRDPVRTVLTLESFARTEADGGADIGSAAGKVADEELRGHLLRHTEDELRHARLFADRAAALRRSVVVPPELEHDAESDQYDLSRGRPATEVDAHGFFTAGLLDELGEVAYVAMLHEAEKRAAQLFAVHADLTAHDPETQAVFDEILRDEKYHVAYTRTILDKWVEQGRGREVDEARSGAKAGRALSAWKRLGVRSAAGFSHVVLRVLYFTLLAPFGLIGRRSRGFDGWQPAPERPPLAERLSSQA